MANIDPDTPLLRALSEKQAAYVKERSRGKGRDASAVMAGYSETKGTGKDIERSAGVQEALAKEAAEYAAAGDITKQEVMDGLKEAINMAKMQADAQSMIRGWSEVAKMCGHYAPEKKQVNVNVRGSGLMKRLESLSDEELLVLARGKIIDVTPERLPDEPSPAAS